jgi:argininosuccinate synthase
VSVEFEEGVPVALNGKRFASAFELFLEATASAAATASA